MKKVLMWSLLTIGLLLAISVTGCSSKKIETTNIVAIDECVIDGVVAANWVCGIVQIPDKMVASGSSNAIGSNYFRKTLAINNARASLASQIETNINIKISSTEIDSVQNNKLEIKNQVDMLLNNSYILAYWKHPETHEIFVLVGIDK